MLGSLVITDAEGCFNVNIYLEPRYKLGLNENQILLVRMIITFVYYSGFT